MRSFGTVFLSFILTSIACSFVTISAVYRLKYSTADWKKCYFDEGKFMMFRNIPIQTCIFKCYVRVKCTAVNYVTRRRECGLLESDGTMAVGYDSMAVGYTIRPCVSLRMADVKYVPKTPGICQGCAINRVCDIMTQECNVDECQVLSILNANVLGNMQMIGSKVTVVPHSGYTLDQYSGDGTATCMTSGEWVPAVRSVVDCGDPPSQGNATVSKGLTEHLTTRTYTCKPGYYVTFPNAMMAVTCLGNGGWTTPSFKCRKCAANWFMFGQSCYYIYDNGNMKTFTNAMGICYSHGAYLVHIETEAENEYIVRYMRGTWTVHLFWIGMTDAEVDGEWKFTRTKTDVTYFNWGQLEPNGLALENCASVYVWSAAWFDHSCTWQSAIICEKGL